LSGEFDVSKFRNHFKFLSDMHQDKLGTLCNNLKHARKLLASSSMHAMVLHCTMHWRESGLVWMQEHTNRTVSQLGSLDGQSRVLETLHDSSGGGMRVGGSGGGKEEGHDESGMSICYV
jgi:hypothetical protein